MNVFEKAVMSVLLILVVTFTVVIVKGYHENQQFKQLAVEYLANHELVCPSDISEVSQTTTNLFTVITVDSTIFWVRRCREENTRTQMVVFNRDSYLNTLSGHGSQL